jgi:hypothetical protein
MEYTCIIIGDRVGLYLELDVDLVGQSEWGSGCICPACVDWGPSVAVDDSQVTDLISWTHLWEREDLLLSSRVSALSGPTVKGRLLGGGLSTALRLCLRCWGLGVPVWSGTWTPWQEWNGLVLFVPRVQIRCVFWGTQLGYIDSRIVVSTWRHDLATA